MMTLMLHRFPEADAFQQRQQRSQFENVCSLPVALCARSKPTNPLLRE
jgi:hypothetical protein